ncbi:hypothetical protein Bhyg_03705 [Pseudolycoriella hygida]|uniref:Uncharacterized protein n=1 Tax=Pseudolycoriella hygida TaxID=35572 RepID=A0A9Q0S9P5_9DIPT|nr:hypothetical protein Bhyg_03705 [Pseudolycoriella hygida]
MNEILQSSKKRLSAATAFYSVIELNSARVGLVNIIKCSNSNTILNITKSSKLIELQQIV